MTTVRVERTVDAPKEVAWAAVADAEAIADMAPNLSRATAEGEGVGMRRRCWDTDDRGWDETCVAWTTGEQYTFAVDTATSGSPMHRLLEGMAGTFGVAERPDGAAVWVEFDLEPRFGPLGTLLVWLARPMVGRGAGSMLDNWAAAIESSVASVGPGRADAGGSGKEES